jgi:hypothetical protein
MNQPPKPSIAIDPELAQDLGANLELVLRGGFPSPQNAADLLRRLNDAIRHSRPKPAA